MMNLTVNIPIESLQQSTISENTNTSISITPKPTNIDRLRKILLISLSILLTSSIFYLIFISFSCLIYIDSWLCQYYKYKYEFIWALISLLYDTLWFATVYRNSARGLAIFAWLTAILLFIFTIRYLLILQTIPGAIMHIQQFSIPMLLISISTIIIDFLTSIFQIIAIVYSFKLAKSLSKMSHH